MQTDPTLEGLWKKVLNDWNDDARHGAFLEYCQSTNQLLEAAVRYRGMAGDRTRGPAAEKRLGAIALLAMATLEVTRTTERPAARRSPATAVVLILLFLAGTIALLLALR